MNTSVDQLILNVPSWVIVGSWIENLRFLQNKKEIEGVELLFFLYDDEVKKELDLQWDEIRRFNQRFIYTAHLPELLFPSHGELVARLVPLVRHFIVHPSTDDPLAQARLLAEWTERYGAVFLAENTKAGNLEALLPLLEQNAGLCMDTGHLLLEGQSPAEFFTQYHDRIKEIHLHGVNNRQLAGEGKLSDHKKLSGGEKWLLELLPLLNGFRGLINVEIFSWEDVKASIEVLPDDLVPSRGKNQR